MSRKVAVVTGANKGIGYAIVKGLCEKFDGTVYLTARDTNKGLAAVKKLKNLGFNPSFHQLDINDQESVDKFKQYIKNNYGGLDLLVNNVGVASSSFPSSLTTFELAQNTVNTNYFGTLRVTETFLSLLRKNARIVNVSSMLGHLSRIPSMELRKKLSDANLTVAKLNDLMNQFLKDFKENVSTERGWGTSYYGVSKVGVSALTRVHQKLADEEYPNKNISINSVHPGYVSTDLTEHRGVLSPDEGAKAPLFVALEARNLKGQFVWNDNRVIDWTAPNMP